jgi:hypothetical protein
VALNGWSGSPRRLGAVVGRGLALLLLVLVGTVMSAQEPAASEYQVKAVFLFNFAQFVDWPAATFADSTAPVVIGVLGDDPFGEILDNTLRDERFAGHPFEVRRFRTVAEVTGCQILFIDGGRHDRPEEVLAALADRPILTVSEGDRFAQRGGMIGFVTDRKRIRLQINLEAAQAAGLVISSKLLRVAEVVHPRSN